MLHVLIPEEKLFASDPLMNTARFLFVSSCKKFPLKRLVSINKKSVLGSEKVLSAEMYLPSSKTLSCELKSTTSTRYASAFGGKKEAISRRKV
jgi:hypothetical protein